MSFPEKNYYDCEFIILKMFGRSKMNVLFISVEDI